MANQEQLDILKQGVKVWNAWRQDHPGIEIDLRDAALRSANLREANFSFVNLRAANLSGTDLWSADLSFANLRTADLWGADLSFANLEGADLSSTSLSDAHLSYTNLSSAKLWSTVFGNIDLGTAKGLETVKHDGPSTIGIDTIYRSHGNIPEVFLKGAGVDDIFITYIRSLVGKPIEYYSCFISYSSKDDGFAKRLYADLQSHNVRCWFAPEDLKIGDKIRPRLDEVHSYL